MTYSWWKPKKDKDFISAISKHGVNYELINEADEARNLTKKLNTSSVTLKSRLKERRQAKIDAKATKSKAINRSTHCKRWTAQED